MQLFYNIIITLLWIASPIVSLFLPKFKKRNQAEKASLQSIKTLNKNKQTLWFHAASMGEFEQAKPIIEYVKKHNQSVQIVCSFFSPSGYDTQINYPFADAICYLPFDTYWKAKQFIKEVQPKAAIFIRYELWMNYICLLNKLHIPLLLANATAPISRFAKRYYRYVFSKIDTIYAVSQNELDKFNILLGEANNTILSNDTRLDRILAKVNEAKEQPILKRSVFNKDSLVFVAGSVWEADVDIIQRAFNQLNANHFQQQFNLVLVPHEPTLEHIVYIQQAFPQNVLLSELLNNERNISTSEVVIVDSIGKLLKLYGVADIAYVGGAFGVGVHSLTEPAGYGIPLSCGANCYNSPDAKPLVDCGALQPMNDAADLYKWLTAVSETASRKSIGNNAKRYIEEHSGATEVVGEKVLGWLR